MKRRVYLDNSATTPLDPRVLDAMLPFLGETYGNPSSIHWSGREARAAVEKARGQVAELIDADPEEIVFTGSGTEADNLAILGLVDASPDSEIITSPIEHPAVLEPCRRLQSQGARVRMLPVNEEGIVQTDILEALITPSTRLISVMAANNVVGTLQPIAQIGAIARERGVPFHTDAVQAAGKVPIRVKSYPIDLLSLSGHKLHGPKGVGALFVRNGISLEPIMFGGGQERGVRSATENVASIVGLGAAAEFARQEMSANNCRMVGLRDRLIEGILAAAPNAYLIGHRYQRLPGHICVGFSGLEGEAIKLLLTMDEAGIAISSGSACSANHAQEPSYILSAMGFDAFRARGSLRITLGRFNDDEDINTFLDVLPRALETMRPIGEF